MSRVAMVSTRYLPSIGGIETHVAEVAPRLVGEGIEVSVLTLDPGGQLREREILDGVEVRRFKVPTRLLEYAAPVSLLAELGSFDLVHVQGVHTVLSPLALNAARRARVPAVLTFHSGGHSSRLRHRLRGLQWQVEAPVLRSAASLIAVCEFEQSTFADKLGVEPSSIALIRNGCDPLPIGEPPDVATGAPLICSVGRLENYKGHHRVLSAMPALLSMAPGARLVIVGSGPASTSLLDQARRLGIAEKVTIRAYPASERATLGALVAAADVVALMSEYEAHPVAVMEALALGKDVVVAETSGLSELGRAGLARTVPLEAPPGELASSLLEAATARRWRSGVPKLDSWDDCARRLGELYNEVLASPSRRTNRAGTPT